MSVAGPDPGSPPPMDMGFVLLATVAVPIVVVQLSRFFLPWQGTTPLVVGTAIGAAGLVAEGRYRGHDGTVIGLAVGCTVVLGPMWTVGLGLTNLLLRAPLST